VGKVFQRLSEATHSVSGNCFLCGFSNLSNFIRIFKKKKDSNPSEYRDLIEYMLIKYERLGEGMRGGAFFQYIEA